MSSTSNAANDPEASTANDASDADSVAELHQQDSGPDGATSHSQPGQESGGTVEELKRLLDEARQRADSSAEHALRVQAEMDNLRKRTEREVENAHKFGTERLLNELLPVLDSMELGLSAADGSSEAETLREGMELTLKMLRGATEKFGVEPVDPEGQAFDPESHQAITLQEVTGEAPGKVVTVVQKGYRLNGRLVRPALVVVSK